MSRIFTETVPLESSCLRTMAIILIEFTFSIMDLLQTITLFDVCMFLPLTKKISPTSRPGNFLMRYSSHRHLQSVWMHQVKTKLSVSPQP